ncbi:subtilase-type protease inhibitor [Streptomyces sp.]|uniref:subtilase-type protease inhibitor n=1 Tax=Streptomyces sp. TaxID=1931 RepID=UPI002D31CADB|nr:subtilase-type protease inhibitor [Streptomyces sp.]HZF91720.1 subtilase-type protease inhibitor [Streptomyces sp.]
MRNFARRAATLALAATALAAPMTGTAQAAPATLYAPSALVLTVGHGETATGVTPERAVTLSCAPRPSGTHPDPVSACAELRRVGGDFTALESESGIVCTRQYDPVVVTVDGVWQGRRVSYERTFANECVMNASATSVYAF